MGASFRNLGETIELAGCDYLTIAPNLLEQLYNSKNPAAQKLRVDNVQELDIEKRTYLDDEALFRFEFNEDTMAVQKLSESIIKFAADAVLKGILREKIVKS
jgi:transaldolase